MTSDLSEAKLRLARAQLGVWKAKLRRLDSKWLRKVDAVQFVETLRDIVTQAAADTGANLHRSTALDALHARLADEAQGAADEITSHLAAPDTGEETQTNEGELE